MASPRPTLNYREWGAAGVLEEGVDSQRPRPGPMSAVGPIPADISDDREVGEGGFEPPTSCSQSRCAARLRYSPDVFGSDLGFRRSGPNSSSSTVLGAQHNPRRTSGRTDMQSVGDLEWLGRSLERHLRAENRSPG